MDGTSLEILTEFGDYYFFDLSRHHTRFTPSLDAVRIGSAVQVRGDFNHAALEVRVIPPYGWMHILEEGERTPEGVGFP